MTTPDRYNNSPSNLLAIARRIRKHHPSKRLGDNDPLIRRSVAQHLWERKGQKGPAAIKKERAEAQRQAEQAELARHREAEAERQEIQARSIFYPSLKSRHPRKG